MAQKIRRLPSNAGRGPKRPIQDVVAVQQAARFPAVGMTLKNNQYSPPRTSRRVATKVKRSRWQRFRQRITLKRFVIALFILIMLIGGWVGLKVVYNTQKIFGGNIFDALSSTKLDGEDKGRVNILLAGNSADDPGHSGAALTDSIMIVSIDTKNNKAFLVSLPRDLWVDVGDEGYQKINGAYVVGEETGFSEEGYPEGGMGQLAQVANEVTGLDINYYALVDYQALKQSVDAVGGVDIVVKSEDPRGLYDPNIDWSNGGPLVKLSNGKHHLNGQEALNFARARGDSYYSYGFAGSDFTRTEHQRQLIIALKSKAVSAGTLSNPAKISSLADAMGDNVETDFQLDEVRRLYDIMKKIESKNITSLSLNEANGESLLMSYNGRGQSALAPAAGVGDYSAIQAYIKQQTSSNPVVREGAKIVVLNGTNVDGLAAKVKTKLTARDYLVSKVGDAGIATQTKTSVIDVTGAKSGTKAALGKFFGAKVTTTNPYEGMYDADFIVVVGTDQASSSGTNNTSQ